MKLLLFDIDGTLTDSVVIHQASYLHAYSKFDIPDLNTDWDSYTHHSDSWIFGEVFRQNFDREPTAQERDLFSRTLSEYFESIAYDQGISEVPGASHFIKQVIDDPNLGYAFATGSLRAPAIRKLESLNVVFSNELLVTASEFETREEIVQAAIRHAENHFKVAKFDKIVSYGDGYWDLITASQLKIDFIGIAQSEKAQLLRDSGAELVLENFLRTR